MDEKWRGTEEHTPKHHEKCELKQKEEKVDTGKEKAKPAFKLQSDVDHSTDVASVVEHYILGRTIEIPLKTLLEISRKDVTYDLTNRARRKRQPIEDVGDPSSTKVMATSIFPTEFKNKDLPKSHSTQNHWAYRAYCCFDSPWIKKVNLMSTKVY